MYPLSEELLPPKNNQSSNYLPSRSKGNDFNWDIITGMVLSQVLKKNFVGYDIEKFKIKCEQNFLSKLDDPSFWKILEKIYFDSSFIFKASPLFLLFKTQTKDAKKASNIRMEDFFSNLIGDLELSGDQDHLNFIEQEMLNILNGELKPLKNNMHENIYFPYLPFLVELFRKDLSFLISKPRYLLQELTNFLKSYVFSFCAQLTLNIKEWRIGEPISKPLYFILDTEKANSEREKIIDHGYKELIKASEHVFPILSTLEVIQLERTKFPLWKLYQNAKDYSDQTFLIKNLNKYIQLFIEDRKLPAKKEADSIESVFKQLIDTAIEQFYDIKTTRSDINKDYVRELNKHIFSYYIQSRGRSGNVLVLNQDQILLLTNIIIGNNGKLRFNELIGSFQARGFYFDIQTKLSLVSFYERMGNIERMSDSGDAVYVYKTI